MDDQDREPISVREQAERYEWIDGVMYDMSPSPSTAHQRIVGTIYARLLAGFEGTGCQVFVAPLDVWPAGRADTGNIVQPDVFVVCDPGKITDAGCDGTPDLVVEVLSPSTVKKDRMKKRALYERCGVRELWLIDAGNRVVEVYRPTESGYSLFPTVFSAEEDESVPVGIHPELSLPLADIFMK